MCERVVSSVGDAPQSLAEPAIEPADVVSSEVTRISLHTDNSQTLVSAEQFATSSPPNNDNNDANHERAPAAGSACSPHCWTVLYVLSLCHLNILHITSCPNITFPLRPLVMPSFCVLLIRHFTSSCHVLSSCSLSLNAQNIASILHMIINLVL